MRKAILLLVSIIGFGIFASAQDIITLKNGEDIQAIVQEIGEVDVKYKKFDNPNGPNYTMKKSEIFMIRYQNGSKDVFSTKSTITPKSEQTLLSNDLKNEFYQIGSDDYEMLEFFKANGFSKYYDVFQIACRKSANGKSLVFMGIGFTLLGTIAIATSKTTKALISGSVAYMVGGTFIIAGIPTAAVAGIRKNVIKDNFEREYFKNTSCTKQPTLNLCFTGSGLGIALKF